MLRRSISGVLTGQGFPKGALNTFVEDAEYVRLERFKLGCWGLPVGLEKLCLDCFHRAVFLFEGI